MAWIDTDGYFNHAHYETIRKQFEEGIFSREEFLAYLPAHIDPDMIDEKGYLIPAVSAPIEIPEPINNRFEILDL